MIKRTPQEIADFFGCYVARDKVCGTFFDLYEEKPEINHEREWWDNARGNSGYLHVGSVDVDLENHDWTHLYEPHSDNKDTANYSKSADFDNKDSANSCEVSRNKQDEAPRQSEVFIHKEYKVICADNQEKLQDKVTLAINEGWNCQGGIAVEHLSMADGYVDDRAIFYQAMVRGV